MHKLDLHILVMAIVVAASVSTARAQTIRLLRVAVVTDREVHVDDVAELAGFDEKTARAIGRLRVVRAPAPGGTRRVSLRQLRATLVAARVNLASVSVRGVTRCDVSRPQRARKPRAPVVNAPTQAIAVPVAGGAAALEPAEAEAPQQTLADAVRAHFRRKLASYEGEPDVMFSFASRDALGLAAPRFSFQIRPRTRRLLGEVRLAVAVRENGKHVETVPVVCEVVLRRKIVVARRPINRGVEIRDGHHIELVERAFSRLEKLGLTDPAAVVGQQAQKFIEPGAMLTTDDVKPITLVKRSQPVSVTLRRGRLVIQTVAKALESGSYGDVIKVVNNASREQYHARIVGRGEVEVAPTLPANRLAVRDREPGS